LDVLADFGKFSTKVPHKVPHKKHKNRTHNQTDTFPGNTGFWVDNLKKAIPHQI